MTPGTWRLPETAVLRDRFAAYLRRAIHSVAKCLQLAPQDDERVPSWWDDLAQLFLVQVQGCTPLYDSMVSAVGLHHWLIPICPPVHLPGLVF